MSSFLFLIAFIIIIYILLRSKGTLRKRIRNIIKKQPNTIRYLKNGTFQKHELLKSLRDKVYAELSGKELTVDGRKLDKIIDQEIINVLKGWNGRIGVYLKSISVIGLCFIALFYFLGKSSESKGVELVDTKLQKEAVTDNSKVDIKKVNDLITSAEAHIGKSEFTLAKQDIDSALKIDSSSQDAIKLLNQVKEKINEENKKKTEEEKRHKNEEHFNTGVALMKNGQAQKAMNQLKKVSKDSELYKEAQKNIGIIKRNQYVNQCKDIAYRDLKKSPDDYKGGNIHFFGRVYNIQEISGKTILSLSTAQNDGEYIGDEAIILFPTGTKLIEGSYIDVYGKMVGNYLNSQQYISNSLNGSRYSIYYDQRTFLDQAPVIETRIIKDSNQWIYGK
ncbi:hypothetical protein A2U94_05440 [Bacillus sp. VT 712]|uniref:hypothetical protein n=1 Tax=Bacillaceae TaxID=186817 RepID=UPI0004737D0C|nr:MULTISPECIES: hypothetical protein [Bacillaceae]KZB92460.1 hypothetical protein A2U94_05440 [Bacillus sp. VT 712]